MKKMRILILAFSLGLVGVITENSFVVNATDFEGKETEYFNKCASPSLAKGDIAVCNEFKEYLSDKNSAIKNNIVDTKEAIANAKDNMAKVTERLNAIDGEIQLVEEQITYLETSILNLETSIQEKDQLVKERMYAMQSYVNSNMYAQFIMGASSFEDLFSRISGINEITSYDKELIRGLMEDKQQVEKDKLEAEASKENLVGLKSQQEQLLAVYQQEAEKLAEQLEESYTQSAQYQEEINAINSNLSSINFADVPSSSSWGKPVSSGVVTSVGFFYPSGAYHLAMDVGVSQGTPVLAPGNGVVLYYSGTGCPSPSGYHYGNTCNGGRGNYMILLVSIDGYTYGVKYYHFNQVSVSGIRSGVVVTKGQTVAYSGNSGQTTGPHLHMEIVNLGSMSLEEGAAYYARYGSTFGLGSNSAARYLNRCDVKGPVCQQNVSATYGVSMGSRF